ncbi:MAG: hypothetical protein DI527_18910 [Chelatococcus sp.]|nr:MAG: hypothetical protein DI527_18910 [Chelatococcus sp.]
MTQVTNLTRAGMEFVVGTKDGAPVTEHLKAGETRDIPIDLGSATVKGRIAAEAIRIGAPASRRAARTDAGGM